MTMRYITRTALTAALLTFGVNAFAAEKIRWLNDWLPAGDKAVIYLAVEKGLFAAEGIEVEIMSGRGSGDVVSKLATGTADMGTGGLASLLQAKAESAVDVTAVMSVYTKQPDAIVADAGLGLKTLKEFKGKTLATPSFSASNVIWPLVLEANGMSADDIKVVKVDPGVMGPMMATGQVDGTINWVTKLPQFEAIMAEAGKKAVVIPWSDYGFEGYGLSVFASDRFIKEKPELVKKVVKVFRQALEMAVADPQAAGDALKARVPEIDATVAAKEFAASVPLISNEISEKDGIGAFEPELLKKTWEWVAKAQNVPLDKIDPNAVVDRSFTAD